MQGSEESCAAYVSATCSFLLLTAIRVQEDSLSTQKETARHLVDMVRQLQSLDEQQAVLPGE